MKFDITASTVFLLGLLLGAATVWFSINEHIEKNPIIDMYFGKPTYNCVKIGSDDEQKD